MKAKIVGTFIGGIVLVILGIVFAMTITDFPPLFVLPLVGGGVCIILAVALTATTGKKNGNVRGNFSHETISVNVEKNDRYKTRQELIEEKDLLEEELAMLKEENEGTETITTNKFKCPQCSYVRQSKEDTSCPYCGYSFAKNEVSPEFEEQLMAIRSRQKARERIEQKRENMPAVAEKPKPTRKKTTAKKTSFAQSIAEIDKKYAKKK